MIRTVLIVDDDEIWIRSLTEKLNRYQDRFRALSAGDGMQAVEILQRTPIALVVTDIQMPRMDGLALLAHLSAHFPDVPAIVVTAYSTPNLKRTVLERGGAGYIEKPFPVEDLAAKILEMLRRESEGGTLPRVPLEMFVQLIEMEQKTCTLRVFDRLSNRQGVLFFQNGTLLDARINERHGTPAAYEIFSWQEVALTIQDTCPVTENRIDRDLQELLLDAMRIRDETTEDVGPKRVASSAVESVVDIDFDDTEPAGHNL